MSILISKGTANNVSIYTSDSSNISNTNNEIIFNKVMSNKISTPMFDYLMDYQNCRINDVRSIMEYNYGNISLEIAESIQKEEIVDNNTILLNNPIKNKALKKTTLIEALKKRETVRKFISKKISIDELSLILKYSFGVKEDTQMLNGYKIPRRYYGSGGGLYPIRTYIFINKVKGINEGIYKYQPITHSLRLIEQDHIELHEFLENQASIDYHNINFAVLFVYEVNKSYMKYGELSLAHAFIEIGLMSQNLHLISSGIGLGTCDIGGFKKVILEKRMHLCGVNRQVLYCALVGKGDEYVGI